MEKKNQKVKKKRKSNNIFITIVVIIITIIILLYLGNSVYTWWQKPINMFIVENGEVSLEENAVGYIIREEQVISNENDTSGILQIKTEEQRVAKGDTVLRYYSAEEVNIQNEIMSIDNQIQTILDSSKINVTSDIKALETQAKTELDELYKNNELQKIQEYKKEISLAIAQKAKVIGKSNSKNSELAELINKREQLEKSLNENSIDLKATESGLVSYRVDGLEDILKTDDFSYLNKKFLESLNLKTGQIIAPNDEKVKIVNNFVGYITTNLKSNEAKDAKIGNKVYLIFANMKEIQGSISYINVEEDDSRTIVFEITKGLDELLKYRKISFDIKWWSSSGWRVPNSSLKIVDGKAYVVRNRAGYMDDILVKVLRQNEVYSIVTRYSTEELKEMGYTSSQINNMSKISLYDEILINPEKE